MTELNPYIDDSGSPVLKESVVAFIDILGYRSLIKDKSGRSAQQSLLLKIRKALSDAYSVLRYKRDQEDDRYPDSWRIKTFTDNIVIGHPIRDDGEWELGWIISNIAAFQFRMIKAGFFVRGAVTIGDIYMDDDIVFGDGLVEAYEEERTAAQNPRIILTEHAKQRVQKYLGYYSDYSWAPQTKDFLEDNDGRYFLNYLFQNVLGDVYEEGPAYEDLGEHRRLVESNLNTFKSDKKIWEKYQWVASYHNYFCDHYDRIDRNYKIDASIFAPGIKEIRGAFEN